MLNQPVRRRAPQSPAPDRSPPRRSGANDNRRIRIVPPPVSPARLAKFGRTVLRLNPYIRLAGWGLDILEILAARQSEGWENLGGWVRYGACSSPDPSYNLPHALIGQTTLANSNTLLNIVNNCLGGQGIIAGSQGNPWAYVNNNSRSVSIGRTRDAFGSLRGENQEAFTRPTNGPFQRPTWRNATPSIALPIRGPQFWPVTADPAIAPPMQAPALAPPVPWRLGPSWTAPNRQAGYSPSGRSHLRTGPVPSGQEVPNEWSLSIQSPAAQGAGQAAPRTHKLVPPRRGGPSARKEKEIKVKVPHALSVILKVAGQATEGVDLVNAIYDALPVEYRPKYKNTSFEKRNVTIQEMMGAIWEHADKLPMDQVINNIIEDNIKDAAFGKLGQLHGDVSIRLGRPYGFGTSGIDSRLRRSFYDAELDDRDRVDGEQ